METPEKKPGGLSSHFNFKSLCKQALIHAAIMGGLMFLTGGAAAAATLGSTATIGDGIVQGFGWGNLEMFFGWMEHIPILGDMFANLLEGNVMPGTTENLMSHGADMAMEHGAEQAAHAGADAAGHAAAETLSETAAQNFSNPQDWMAAQPPEVQNQITDHAGFWGDAAPLDGINDGFGEPVLSR